MHIMTLCALQKYITKTSGRNRHHSISFPSADIMFFVSVLSLAVASSSELPYREPGYPGYPAPPPYHPPPPPPGYPPIPGYIQAIHHPYYGYGIPKENCSIQDVVEPVEVCTPAFETVCNPVELPIKKIVDREMCYPVTRTVCEVSIEVVENEICTYSSAQKTEDTTAQTVVVTFERICDTQMVTVCQPTPGYGYHSYGHNYCKEVAQETCYNSPVVAVDEPAVTVAYPEPVKTCVQKPIDLPIISCEDIKTDKCIVVPEVEDAVETVEKCITQLGAPDCSTVELTLPKQVCRGIVYSGQLPPPPPPPPPQYPYVAKQ